MATAALPWDVVDRAYSHKLTPDLVDRWLLIQTLATGPSRRALFGGLGLGPGASVLDVGTGFGPIPLELAGMVPLAAVGVDRSLPHLEVAGELAKELEVAGWIQRQSTIEFVEGDAYSLPVETDRFDLATSRLLFQHLDDPVRAADELHRVVKRRPLLDLPGAVGVVRAAPACVSRSAGGKRW
jgi:ubiquinone/menaquinone biosynthesis C-methylase UbiE